MIGLFKKKAPEAPKKADSATKTKAVDNSTPAPNKPVKKEFVKTDSLCKEIALIKDENGHLLPEINPYLIFSNLIQDNDMIDIDTINALVKNDKS